MSEKLKTDKIKKKINTEEDFIHCPRMGNSLEKYMSRYPEGVDNEKIAKVLLMEEEEVEEVFQSAVRKLRAEMGIEDEDVV